jgi:cobalt-zinc-cadmium efflux system outer membrane protein
MYRSRWTPIVMAALALGGGCRAPGRPEPGNNRIMEQGAPAPSRYSRVPAAPSSGVRAGRAAPREPNIPEPAGVITLRDAQALALAQSPGLAVFPYDMRAADARLVQAGLWPNPELTVEVEEFGGAGARRSFDAAETTVRIGQLLELGHKRARRTRVAALDRELVQWDYRSARLDVVREATQAFMATLAAQERLALAERLLELSGRAQATVAQRVKAGKDSPVDELKADVALAESRIERQKAQQALAAARHALAAAWGGRTPVFESVAGDFYAVAAPQPLEQMQALIAANPDLARWETEEQQRRAALHLEQARAVPDIAVDGGVRRFEETDDAALVLALGVPLPLFNRNQGGVQEAVANLAKTRRQYEAVQVRTLAALAEAASTLAGAHQAVAILQGDVLPKAQQTFAAAAQGYEQGKFDYLYILDAQRTLFRTQAQYIDSVEAYHRARAEVERLIGGPPDDADRDLSLRSLPEPLSKEYSHEN